MTVSPTRIIVIERPLGGDWVKLTVLTESNTLTDKNFFGKPGLSLFVEADGNRILFDTGYSDMFMLNAYGLGIDLKDIDMVILSHGHWDLTWGLSYLIENLNYFGATSKKIKLIAHPGAFYPKEINGQQVGMLLSSDQLKNSFLVMPSKDPIWITDNLLFLGEIQRKHSFENTHPYGITIQDGVTCDDYMLDDSALAYKTPDGIVIITGCSHAGICNIIDQAKDLCGDDRIVDIVGGFQLDTLSKEQINATARYIKTTCPPRLHISSCSSPVSEAAFSAVELLEMHVGLTLNY